MRPKYFVLCAAGLLLASGTRCALAQDSGALAPLISSGRPASAAAASSPDGQRTLRDQSSAGGLRDSSAALRDESWTATRNEHTGSPTQSSRAVQHLSDSTAAPQRVPSQPTADSAGSVYPSSGTTHLRSHVAQAQFTSAATTTPIEPNRDGADTNLAADEHRPLKPPTADDPVSDEKRSTGTVQMFISVISSLLIVVGILLGAAWCYRKATPNLTGGLPKQVLQVLGRTPLAQRQQLILVRFGPKLVLMSNLQGEVRTISEIVDPMEVDRICGLCESSQAGSISDSFRTVLHNIGRTG